MDIDQPLAAAGTPPGAADHSIPLPEFSASFPLPFRVLFLVGFAILLWAVNLHVLSALGLDVSWVLDIRDGDDGDRHLLRGGAGAGRHGADERDAARAADAESDREQPARPSETPRRAKIERPPSSMLYGPVYRLFVVYAAWCALGWLLFCALTGGQPAAMETYRLLVGLVCLGPVAAALVPFRGAAARERRALRRALWRCINPPARDPIFFCDVILADVLTSFAKVLGDLFVSAHQIVFGGITKGRVPQHGLTKWITLAMVCLPYVIRFRQCMLEFYHSGWTSLRPFANALKYCSAFPVIFLSAAQGIVVSDVAAAKGMSVEQLSQSGERWFGEHRLFRLWLLAVAVNSMYSFYWDVEKDWGLSLLELDTWLPSAGRNSRATSPGSGYLTPSSRPSSPRRAGAATGPLGWLRTAFSRSADTAPLGTAPWGLRPTLLLPDIGVYYLFTVVDLVLRFTWSLELSSHLHVVSDLESGVFLMEALELLRRWMWVFIRVEWEAVRMGEMQRFRAGAAAGDGACEARTAVLWENDKADDE